MSYLEMLQRLRQQGSPFEQFVSSGAGALEGVGMALQRQQEIAQRQQEAARQRAQERAKLEQVNIQSLLSAGQTREAAQRVANLRQDLRAGYDMNLPTGPVSGAPVMKPLQGPSVPPSMRAGMRPELATPEFFQRKVGESFETPEAKRAVYAGAMLPQPKRNLIEVSGALYDPDAGTWVTSPAAMTPELRRQLQEERLKSQQEIAQARIEAAAARGAGGGREPRYTWITMPDGSRQRVRDREGLVSAATAYTGFVEDPVTGEPVPVTIPRIKKPAGTPAAPRPSARGKYTPLSPNQEKIIADELSLQIKQGVTNPEFAKAMIRRDAALSAAYDAELKRRIQAANEAKRQAAGGASNKPQKSNIERLLGE